VTRSFSPCAFLFLGLRIVSVKLSLDSKTDAMLAQMSWESGLSKVDLAEIAVFNLVALWMKDKHEADYAVPMAAHDGVDVSG
jgi:hypothetical protein